MKFEPRTYQTRAIDFVLSTPKCALHIDMGLGKTVSVLTALQELRDSWQMTRALVFAPLRVATLTWPDEIDKWDHIDLDYVVVRGSPDERIRLLMEDRDLYLINYDVMTWLFKWMRDLKTRRFDCLVLDESSKLKSSASKRYRAIKPFCKVGWFKRVIEMTGTPMPENYENLWSQYFLLDQGDRLLPFVTHFRDRYFDQSAWSQYVRTIKPGAAEKIQDKIRDITMSLMSQDWLDLPEVVTNDVMVELPPKARAVYDDFEKEMIAKIDGDEIIAGNAAVVAEKCRQACAGTVYNEEGDPVHVHDVKTDTIAEIIEVAEGPTLVAYWYRWELGLLKTKLNNPPYLGPGITDELASKTIKAWNIGNLPVLLIHPASVGHGLNLQHGGSNLVFATLPWSGEVYSQTVHRLHRIGQERGVVVHRVLVADSVDERVASVLGDKALTQKELMRALRK